MAEYKILYYDGEDDIWDFLSDSYPSLEEAKTKASKELSVDFTEVLIVEIKSRTKVKTTLEFEDVT